MTHENPYDKRYEGEPYYWGVKPSLTCFEVLKRKPPERHLRLLDIGCGEGRNAIFFARNGYDVTAFDLSERGVEKTQQLAQRAGASIRVFQADVNTFRLEEEFDIIFSTGVMHYIPPALRVEIFRNYQQFTLPGGLNVFSVFVHKPFLPPAPDAEPSAHLYTSGELFTYYTDWRIEYCTEQIFDCMSSGIPHQHATNRLVARKEPAP